jgi:hypothetical protein
MIGIKGGNGKSDFLHRYPLSDDLRSEIAECRLKSLPSKRKAFQLAI